MFLFYSASLPICEDLHKWAKMQPKIMKKPTFQWVLVANPVFCNQNSFIAAKNHVFATKTHHCYQTSCKHPPFHVVWLQKMVCNQKICLHPKLMKMLFCYLPIFEDDLEITISFGSVQPEPCNQNSCFYEGKNEGSARAIMGKMREMRDLWGALWGKWGIEDIVGKMRNRGFVGILMRYIAVLTHCHLNFIMFLF